MAVSNDSKRSPANFVRTTCRFVPATCMQLRRFFKEPSKEADRFGNSHLCNAARIAERRIENRGSTCFGSKQINLICTDAEASDCNKMGVIRELRRAHFSLGSNPHNTCSSKCAVKFCSCKSACDALHLKASFDQDRIRNGMNRFKK